MCIAQPKAIAAPLVTAAPTTQQIAANAANNSVGTSRELLKKRQGVFGNVKTTPMGDASFSSSAVARFGAYAG